MSGWKQIKHPRRDRKSFQYSIGFSDGMEFARKRNKELLKSLRWAEKYFSMTPQPAKE